MKLIVHPKNSFNKAEENVLHMIIKDARNLLEKHNISLPSNNLNQELYKII